MKRAILLLTIFLSVFSYSQDHAKDLEEIKTLLEEINRYVALGEYEKSWDNLYDPYLELLTKNGNLELIKKNHEENENFRFEHDLDNFNPTYSEIYKKEGGKYVFAWQRTKTKITFLNPEFDVEQREDLRLKFKSMGMEVSELEGNSFTYVYKDNVMIFINDKETNGQWRYVGYDLNNELQYYSDPNLVLPNYIQEGAINFHENLMEEKGLNKEDNDDNES